MGIYSESVSFEHRLPTAAELVTVLCRHTGEVVLFDAAMGVLSCRATGEAFWAYVDEADRSWLLRNVNLDGGYLWEASLAVLQLLGGQWTNPHFTQPPSLPVWAYQPWQLAKKDYNKRYKEHFLWLAGSGLLQGVWKAVYQTQRVPWLTHDQACQQGLGWK
jgi:hypothetical protein